MRLLALFLLTAFSAAAQPALGPDGRRAATSETAPQALLATFLSAESGRTSYRTVLLAPADSGRYRSVAAGGVWTLRDTTVLRIGARTSRYNDWTERFLWAAPPGGPPQLRGIDAYNGEYCEGRRRQTLRYVGPRHVGYETESHGACEGAAHPWRIRALAVVPTDSLDHPGVDLTGLLGVELQALEDEAAANLARLTDEQAARWLEVPDAANWLPVRRDGQWRVQMRLDAIDLASRGQVRDFLASLPVPDTLLGRTGADDLTRARRQVSGARDAFVSPTGALAGVRRQGLLTLHRVERGRYGRALVGFPVPTDADLIQLRWLAPPESRAIERALRRGT